MTQPLPSLTPRPLLLLLCWSRTAETLRHARLVARRAARLVEVLIAWMEEGRLVLAGEAASAPLAAFRIPDEIRQAARFLRDRDLRRIDVLRAGAGGEGIDLLLDAFDVPLDLTLLDHSVVSPHPLLAPDAGAFPGEEAVERERPRFLRPRPELFAARAERIVATSHDLALRIERLVPGLGVRAAPPPEEAAPERYKVRLWREAPAGRATEVLLLGDLVPQTGRDVLVEAAALVARNALPIAFTVIGRVHPRLSLAERSGAAITLAAPEEGGDLTAAIAGLGPDLAWFPYRAPRSHDFAVTDALLNGLPILGSAIGGLPERVAGRPLTWLLPHGAQAADWVAFLMRLRTEGPPAAPAATAGEGPRSPGYYDADYLAPLLTGTDQP